MVPFHQHSFLLIDDSEIDSIITSKLLQLSGLPKSNVYVRHANDAIDFLNNTELLNRQTEDGEDIPLIILLDIHMPEISGFDFLEQMEDLSDQITNQCRVFLLTSSIDPMDIERANLNRFVVRVLNKPLQMDEFLYFFED